MNRSLLRLDLVHDRDIVTARQRARQVSALLGFDSQDQVRIATAVSELARNAIRHGGGGNIEFGLLAPPSLGVGQTQNLTLQIVIGDRGPGMTDFDDVTLDSAMSEAKLGLIAARRLMDTFDVYSHKGQGTTITLGKALPRRPERLDAARIASIANELSAYGMTDVTAEMQQQNRDLLRSLEELRVRKEELARLNAELEDTNRGVMALYAELEERASHLRLADETKTRFLSAMSHEFRTPVNSILALSRILLHRLDGDLSPEQEKQVVYIRQAAEQLANMVDDLLDLRKVESGKLQVRPETFTVTDLFGALRGMFKPLNVKDCVSLIFEDPATTLPELYTDLGKVSQILRNLISNALKFTEAGSVRVTAKLAADTDMIVFTVADTGIGIAPENHRHVFEEFTQVENPLQKSVKGTGLGLPLSQRLAGLLGGSIDLASELGRGSTFSLVIPWRLPKSQVSDEATATPPVTRRVLIIDDSEVERYALRQFLPAGSYDVLEATGGYDGLRLARQSHPDLIFLDLAMPDVHGLEVLKMLQAIDETRDIPVVLFTSQHADDISAERSAAARALLLKSELSRESVAAVIRRVTYAEEIHDASPT